MNEKHFYNYLEDCLKIIKENIKDVSVFIDFESKVYAEGIRSDLSVVKHHLSKNSKVLDIGCGKGHISVLLKKCGFVVYGIDIEETEDEQLGILGDKWRLDIWKEFKNKYNINYQYYSGKEIPFENGSFDAVVAYAVIEHVNNDRVFLQEVKRVLKKGGHFFIFRCPCRHAAMEYLARVVRLPYHKKLVDDKEIEQLLSSFNFKILKLERTDMIPGFPPYKIIKFWNLCSPFFMTINKLLLKTPLSYFSHHIRIVAIKNS